MEKLANLLGKHQGPPKKSHKSERGDLLDTFLAQLNPPRVKAGYRPLTYGRLSYLLTGVATADLYALQSKCADAERRGVEWGAAFWTELRPSAAR